MPAHPEDLICFLEECESCDPVPATAEIQMLRFIDGLPEGFLLYVPIDEPLWRDRLCEAIWGLHTCERTVSPPDGGCEVGYCGEHTWDGPTHACGDGIPCDESCCDGVPPETKPLPPDGEHVPCPRDGIDCTSDCYNFDTPKEGT